MSKMIMQEHSSNTLTVENIEKSTMFCIVLNRDSQEKGK